MANALTPLGRELRKLRLDAGERIYDLAEAIKVTASFISALELGKKQIPDNFLSRVVEHYGLSQAVSEELYRVGELSAKAVKIPLEQRTDASRELAVAFARAFPKIGDEEAKVLISQFKIRNQGDRNDMAKLGSRAAKPRTD